MKRILALALAAIVMLSGCAVLLEREYTSVSKHNEQYSEVDDSSALVVQNYLGLKNALLYFVGEGMDYGVIRVYDYVGDVSEDLTEVCLSLKQSTPLGAFAVDYISHEKLNIVSYTELHIYITYRRTVEQIKSVESLQNDGLNARVSGALEQMDDYMALSFSYFTGDEAYLLSLIKTIVGNTYMPAEPEFTVELYPESGVQRIVEISISYPGGAELFGERRTEMKALIDDIAASLSADASAYTKSEALAAELLTRSNLLETAADAFSEGAYGALSGTGADCWGMARAFRQLCMAAGVDCVLVEGTRDGAARAWNMVRLDSGWYHIDTTAAKEQGLGYAPFYSDAEMRGVYQWARSDYPESGESLTPSDSVPQAD